MWTTNDIPNQTGKRVVITGSNTGIGFETAKALYDKGAHVTLACRDIAKANAASVKLTETPGPGKIEVAHLDLSSLKSIKAFTDRYRERSSVLDLLINNAGIMTPPHGFTAEGYELQFGVNFLGHFALTGELYPLIRETRASRIVTVTSLGYIHGNINFANLRSEESYDAFREYCQSKLANILFTNELQRKIDTKGDQVLSLASHPGVTKTEISRHMSDQELNDAIKLYGALMETAQGALPTLYAAVSPEVEKGGFYGPDNDGGLRGYPTRNPVLEQALDETIGKSLWNWAEQATNIVFP